MSAPTSQKSSLLTALRQRTERTKDSQAAAVAERMAAGATDPDAVVLLMDQIEVREQVRKHFDKEALQQLAESIRDEGLKQAITVRRIAPHRYLIETGERRLRACRDILGWETIPARVQNRDHVPAEEFEADIIRAQLTENLQREDLRPLELADEFARLKQITEASNKDLARQVHRSEAFVSKHLSLLEAPEDVRAAIREGALAANLYFDNKKLFEHGMPPTDGEGGKRQAPGKGGARAGKKDPKDGFVRLPYVAAVHLFEILRLTAKRVKAKSIEPIGELDKKQLAALLSKHAHDVRKRLKG